MGMTIAEKIIARAAGVSEVRPGDIHTVEVDRLMSNDGTTHLTVDMYNNKLKHPHIADPKKMVFIVDHNVPADSPKTAASQKKMRDFARENNIDFWEGKGVCHQIMMENYVCPGELIFGADSHTCTYGALGAFGTGVGCTDLLYGMVTGTSWVLVPETVKFNLTGKLGKWVSGKDVILHIIGMIGVDGALYQSMEFTGDGLKNLSMDDRLCMANMAIEAGAKNGIFEVDDVTLEYVKGRTDRKFEVFKADPDAHYNRVIDIDLSTIRPTIAFPHLPENTKTIDEIGKMDKIKIDQVVIGSCTNGRYSDLEAAAKVVKGKHVAKGVRAIVIPATQQIYLDALRSGLLETFVEAGMVVSAPTCGPCLGGHMGILAPGERAVSTTNRNFVGRMGDVTSEVYLASPAIAAASALTGYISDVQE